MWRGQYCMDRLSYAYIPRYTCAPFTHAQLSFRALAICPLQAVVGILHSRSAAVPMTRHISPVNGVVFPASIEKPAWICSGAGRENGVNQRTTLSKASSVMIGRGRQRGGQLPCPSCR